MRMYYEELIELAKEVRMPLDATDSLSAKMRATTRCMTIIDVLTKLDLLA